MDTLTLLPPIFYAITTVFWIFLIIIALKRFNYYRQEQPLFSKLSIIVGFFAFTAALSNILFIYRYLGSPHVEMMMWVDWAILALNTTAAIVTSSLFTHKSMSEAISNIVHKINILDELNLEKEEQVEKLNEKDDFIHLQNVLMDIQQIMIQATFPNKMFDKICHELCKYPSFNVVWIGFAEKDSTKLPISFFHDSAEPRFLSNDFETLLDSEEPYTNGPTSQAMLTCKSVVIEDTQNDLRFSQWHSRAKFSQIKSVIAIPMILKEGEKPIGVLNIYSKDTINVESPVINILEGITQVMAKHIVRLNNYIKSEKLKQRNSNELNILKSVIDAIPDSIFWKDTNLRYLGANKQFLEHENISLVSNILGKTDKEIQWGISRDKDNEIEAEVLSTNKDIDKTIQYVNNKYCLDNKCRLFDSNNTLLGLISIRSDINDSYNTELELKRNEKLYHEILKSIPNLAIQHFDSNREIIKWNKYNTTMFGYTEEEAIGRKVEQLIYPKDLRDDFINKVDSCLTLNKPIKLMKMKLLNKEGQEVAVQGSYILQNRFSKNPTFISLYIKL